MHGRESSAALNPVYTYTLDLNRNTACAMRCALSLLTSYYYFLQVAILPFIDEERLLKALQSLEITLTEEERLQVPTHPSPS